MGIKVYVALGFIVFSSTYFKNYVKHIVEYFFYGLENDFIGFMKSNVFFLILASFLIYTLFAFLIGKSYKESLCESVNSISFLLECSFDLSNYLSSNNMNLSKNNTVNKYNFTLEEIFKDELSINFPGKRRNLNETLTIESQTKDINYIGNHRYLNYLQNSICSEGINVFNIPASFIKLNFRSKKVRYHYNCNILRVNLN
jgi:hypothetical protein